MGRRIDRNKNVAISEMYCTQCGNKGVPIPRRVGQYREAGHLKNLFCLYCGKETNHVEVRPFGSYSIENFQEEFQLGRFLENGQRIPVAELLKCSNQECPYLKDGNCWNSNNSYDCGYKPKEAN